MAETLASAKELRRKDLRRVFGKFPTGVTVVTTRNAAGDPIGFTANSFTSVSLDPPLLLVCLEKCSANLDSFTQSNHFAVNILSDKQMDISNRFASRVAERFAEIAWHPGPADVPLLEDTVAWFACETDNVVDAGDHVILIGRIFDFHGSEARPLAYHAGNYLDLGLGELAAHSVVKQAGVQVGCVLEHTGQVLLRRSGDGWTLPMGDPAQSLRHGRKQLATYLAQQGVGASMGLLYSVFDAPSGTATCLVFLGDIESLEPNPNFKLFSLDNLPIEQIDLKFHRSLLARFQTERRLSRFGIYVDDPTVSGTIHQDDRRITPWTRFIAVKETCS